MRILRLALLFVLAFPAAALAEDATIVSRDVPLAGERSLASSKAPARFNLVGLHWRGAGSVQFRTRSLAGRWGAWQDAAPESTSARTSESRSEASDPRGRREGRAGWP